jgi:hypothetical protein
LPVNLPISALALSIAPDLRKANKVIFFNNPTNHFTAELLFSSDRDIYKSTHGRKEDPTLDYFYEKHTSQYGFMQMNYTYTNSSDRSC